MREFVTQYLPWLLSCVSIAMTYLAGSLHRKAWLLGLITQSLWLIWILCSKNYGFLPQNAMLWLIYTRNHLHWKKLKIGQKP